MGSIDRSCEAFWRLRKQGRREIVAMVKKKKLHEFWRHRHDFQSKDEVANDWLLHVASVKKASTRSWRHHVTDPVSAHTTDLSGLWKNERIKR